MYEAIGLFVALFAIGIFTMLKTALAADRDTNMKTQDWESYGVADAAQIYAGSLVGLNASGYAVAMADTTAYKFLGVSMENVLGATNGVKQVKVWRRGTFLFTTAGIAITDIGKKVYAGDDQTVALTSSHFHQVGVLTEYVSATSNWITINEAGPPSRLTLKFGYTNSATVAVALFTAPIGTIVHDVLVEVTTEIATATLEVGITGDADAFVNDRDIGSATGFIVGAGGDAHTYGAELVGADQTGSNIMTAYLFTAATIVTYTTTDDAGVIGNIYIDVTLP